MTRLVLVFLGLFIVSACTPSTPAAPVFQGTDITGVDWGRDFNLVDQNGQRRTLADFRGKVVALFFGYTHCPDVCPTTLAALAATLKQLGARADKVQVLFVTLDPVRDTPQVLKQYVPSFNPTFIGLTGTESDVAQTASAFKVFYQKQKSEGGRGYTLDHSANTFVFDTVGRLRLMYGFGTPEEKIVQDINRLIQ